MYGKYMKLHKERNVMYIKEEVCGIELDLIRLNLATRATMIQFFQFFNERSRMMPLVVNNERDYLKAARELYSDSTPIKAAISRVGNYLIIDTSKEIDNEPFRVSSDYRVIKDVRKLFENV